MSGQIDQKLAARLHKTTEGDSLGKSPCYGVDVEVRSPDSHRGNCTLWLGIVALLASQWILGELRPAPLAVEVTANVRMRLVDAPVQTSHGLRFSATLFEATDRAIPLHARLRMYCYAPCNGQKLAAGRSYAAVVSLRPPRVASNPSSFNYSRWLSDRGYQALGTVRTRPRQIAPAAWPDRLRNLALKQLHDSTTGFTHQPSMLALLTGQRQLLSKQQHAQLLATGTMHLLVVSGLHLGLAMLMLVALARRLGLGQAWQLGLGLIAMLSYVWLSGFGAPAVRALVMASLAGCWLLSSRQFSPWLALGAALLLVGWFRYPLWRDSGVLLSFGAVAVLVAGFYARGKHNKFVALLRAQWLLFVLLGLLQIALFDRLSLVGLVTNLLLVPLTGLVLLPLLLVGALLGLVWPLAAHWLWWPANLLLDLAWRLLAWASGLPGAQWHIPGELSHDWKVLVPAIALALVALLPRGLPLSWLLAPVALLPFVWWQTPQHPLDATLLATRADIYLLVREHDRLLVVAAAADTALSQADLQLVVYPAMRYARVRQIDWLALNRAALMSPDATQLRQDQHLAGLEYCQLHGWPQLSVEPRNNHCALRLQSGWIIEPRMEKPPNMHLISTSEALALAAYRPSAQQHCLVVGRGLPPDVLGKCSNISRLGAQLLE